MVSGFIWLRSTTEPAIRTGVLREGLVFRVSGLGLGF